MENIQALGLILIIIKRSLTILAMGKCVLMIMFGFDVDKTVYNYVLRVLGSIRYSVYNVFQGDISRIASSLAR